MTLTSPDLPMFVLHQAVFGALAAAGFGVLFNFGPRTLAWCSGMGAIALAVRTVALSAAWSLEAATFVAALVTSALVSACLTRRGSAADAIARVCEAAGAARRVARQAEWSRLAATIVDFEEVL